jgi:hypothetical protein
MTFKIDEKRSPVGEGISMAVVAVADQADELTGVNARNAAMQYARSVGFPARGLGGIPSPYPVDKEGKTDDDLILGRRPIDHWEAVYQVNSGLGV